MQFRRLEAEWDEDNVGHISRHGVEPEEVEEIVYEGCHPSRILRVRRRGIRESRWAVFGQTCAGRYLLAIVAPYSQRGVWRAVTARDMGSSGQTEVSAVAERLTASHRRTLREEAADWDRLGDDSLTRLFDKGRPLRLRVRRPLPRVLPVALDEATLNGLKRIARRKQIEVRHLAAMWIAERLAQEYGASRPRRMA